MTSSMDPKGLTGLRILEKIPCVFLESYLIFFRSIVISILLNNIEPWFVIKTLTDSNIGKHIKKRCRRKIWHFGLLIVYTRDVPNHVSKVTMILKFDNCAIAVIMRKGCSTTHFGIGTNLLHNLLQTYTKFALLLFMIAKYLEQAETIFSIH